MQSQVSFSRRMERAFTSQAEIAQAPASSTAGASDPILSKADFVQQDADMPTVNGLLTVIDTARAEAPPSAAAILTNKRYGSQRCRAYRSRPRPDDFDGPLPTRV